MILKILLALVLTLGALILAAYFGPPTVVANSREVTAQPAVIFVHGFYGAALRDRHNGRRYFYSVREALFGRTALSLFASELSAPAAPELEVEGLIGHVPVLPFLFEEDAYSLFLKRLRGNLPANTQLLTLAYDWRDDLELAVAQLAALVEKLEAQGSPSIQILAHSMGGMVTSYYLGYGRQPLAQAKLNWAGARKVKSVAFFGTPFRGSLIAFRSFIKGSGLTLSQRTMPAEAMSTFPALFQLLPHGPGKFLDRQGRAHPLDLFGLEIWRENGFGLLRRQDLPESARAARDKFTQNWLARAKLWSERIQLAGGAPPPAHLRVLNVLGRGQETLDVGYYLSDTESRVLFDPADTAREGLDPKAVFGDGDFSTTWESGQLPHGLARVGKTVTTTYTHGKLFLDPAIEAEYKAFLQP